MSLAMAMDQLASATAKTTMKLRITVAQNPHQCFAIDVFAKDVETRTAGRYTIQTSYNGSLVGEREFIEAVQLGTADAVLDGPIAQELQAKFVTTVTSVNAGFEKTRQGSMVSLESVRMFWGYAAMPVDGVFCIIANLLDPQRQELETAT